MGQRGHCNNSGLYFFFMEKETKLNWQQVFLYATEEYKQLRQLSRLVISVIYIVLRGRWLISLF